MKNRLLFLVLALAICLPAAPALRAQEHEQKKLEEETELGRTMEKMNGAWRKLRRQVSDAASNAASLELVATIKGCANQALVYKPARVADVPAADQEKFVADYLAEMKEFIATVGELETALKAGDNAAAGNLVKKMGLTQRQAHKQFKRTDE